MKIGVLIPTYNRCIYFTQALESVVGQTYRDLEIIVIDNGSNNEIGTLVNELNDPRVRYVRNEQNIGLIGSIRKGIQFFSEKVLWCTILPDDDLLHREFISSMVCYIERHPDIDVVHGHRKMIDAAGNHLGETSLPPERESAVQYLVARSRFIRQTFLTGVFFSRSAYERIGGYPQFATGMASDDALIFALSVQHDLYFNGKALSSIRLHAEAESYGHEDVFRHFQAFEQFGRYVEYKASREDRFTARDLKSVKSAFTRYARPTISELWLRRVHHCLKREKLSRIPELEDLYAIAVSGRYPFSLRVRLSGFAARKAGYCPEKNLFYRTLWYIWFICYKCLFRIMPQCIAI